MSEEYAISAGAFIAALREQREMRLKGGLYHLNQIQMAYNSNRIEGSQLTEEQTRYVFETRTVTGEALSVDDVVETANHFRAFDEMLDRFEQPITPDTLRDYHRILKSSTSDAAKPWFAVGDWKQVPNAVGGLDTSAPADVQRDVDRLFAQTPGSMSFADIGRFHHRFESIHPFQDGNGRVGRLVMFQQCMQHGIMPFIVLDADKEFYYRGLRAYDEQPGFLEGTFRKFQDDYYERYSRFVPRLESGHSGAAPSHGSDDE